MIAPNLYTERVITIGAASFVHRTYPGIVAAVQSIRSAIPIREGFRTDPYRRDARGRFARRVRV